MGFEKAVGATEASVGILPSAVGRFHRRTLANLHFYRRACTAARRQPRFRTVSLDIRRSMVIDLGGRVRSSGRHSDRSSRFTPEDITWKFEDCRLHAEVG